MRLKVSNVCQLLDKSKYPATHTQLGCTFTNNGDGSFTINGTIQNGGSWSNPLQQITQNLYGHKILLLTNSTSDIIRGEMKFTLQDGSSRWGTYNSIYTVIYDNYKYLNIRIYMDNVDAGKTIDNATVKFQLFDLTEMYGAGNEPTTVAQFRQDFPNEMYEYSPECWKKFRRLKYVTETKNLFDVNNAVPYTFSTDNPDGNLIWLKDGIYTTRMNNYNIGSGLRIKSGLTLPAGVYTLSVKVVDSSDFGTGGYANIGFYYKIADGTWHALMGPRYSYAPGTTLSSAINIPEHIELRLYLNYQNMNGQFLAGYISYKDIQLEQGSTATPYQPYGYLPLNRGKYIANKEPVQLLDKSKFPATKTENGITWTNNGDGTITTTGNASNSGAWLNIGNLTVILISSHKYLLCGCPSGGATNTYWLRFSPLIAGNPKDLGNGIIFTVQETTTCHPLLQINSGLGDNLVWKPQLFDLTEMYGAGNEPTTVAQFRADFPNELYDYNPYNAITFR